MNSFSVYINYAKIFRIESASLISLRFASFGNFVAVLRLPGMRDLFAMKLPNEAKRSEMHEVHSIYIYREINYEAIL